MPTQEGGIYITGEDGRGREQEHKLGWGGVRQKQSTNQPLNHSMKQWHKRRTTDLSLLTICPGFQNSVSMTTQTPTTTPPMTPPV